MGSFVDPRMRMTVHPCVFAYANPLGLHGGSCLVVHSGHPSHMVTYLIHEYHVNILWISVPSRGFRGTTLVGIL
jgi:hypothetical protein